MTKTILVVDDEVSLAEVLVHVLESQDYHVLTAHDGLEALEVIGNNHIDLLISDYMMPRLNGIGLYEHLYKDQVQSFPMIMMSAVPDALSALPVYAVLKKPFQFEEFIDVVKRGVSGV